MSPWMDYYAGGVEAGYTACSPPTTSSISCGLCQELQWCLSMLCTLMLCAQHDDFSCFVALSRTLWYMFMKRIVIVMNCVIVRTELWWVVEHAVTSILTAICRAWSIAHHSDTCHFITLRQLSIRQHNVNMSDNNLDFPVSLLWPSALCVFIVQFTNTYY